MAGGTSEAGNNEHMDLTATARAVSQLSTSVHSLQVAGFGFILLTGQRHTPFLLPWAFQLQGFLLLKLQECLYRQEVRPGSSLLLQSFPSLILWMLSKMPVLLVL